MKNRESVKILFLLAWLLISSNLIYSGPPYDTDDPEPVELHHWEFYMSSRPVHDDAGWSGTLPHVEVNYGAVKNIQLHFITPMAFNFPVGEPKNYGLGDTELGVKYRFLQECKSTPMIGIFPLIELPTGNRDKGLGNGKAQLYLPLWIQKSFGDWMTYGGGGYWINPGEGNRNWIYTGWLIQNQLTRKFNLGVELYYMTPQESGGISETRFNIGAVYDFSEKHHLLLSAGKGILGPVKAQFYVGYQLTLGPMN